MGSHRFRVFALLPHVDWNAEQQQQQSVQDRSGAATVHREDREEKRDHFDGTDARQHAACGPPPTAINPSASAQKTYAITPVIVARLTSIV